MNLAQAIEHASTLFFPDFIFAMGDAAMMDERSKNEEAIKLLRDAYMSSESPAFGFDLVRELADRNRELCDEIGSERFENMNGVNLDRALSDADTIAGIAAMQRRRPSVVAREVAGNRDNLGAVYASAKIKGTVVGVDIETTGRDPDRGYIINVGWQVMELTSDATPSGDFSTFCGIPDMYEAKGVPLARIHKITWTQVAGKTPFRQDKALQKQLLKLLQSHPYMAHNAAFEDSWFMLHLDGYAEARKAGKIIPIDTREICRRLDPDVRRLPREDSPAALENWAKRRGTLAADEAERHLGLEDVDLMLRTTQAEFMERNMLAK